MNLAPDGTKNQENQEYYFAVEEHYEDYYSLINKCLMLYLISLIL